MLTADELCEICGTTLAQRQAWAKGGALRQQRGFEELDAVELMAYARLREAAGPKRGKAAWRDLRGPLQRFLLKPPRRLWIVIETTGIERHGLAIRLSELSKRVEHGRSVVVVELRQAIDDARAAYRDATSRKRRSDVTEAREFGPGG
ncbi:MAG: hypothetical protein HZB14_00510 [Actinobacteria bacterium]|nr:hypothetical protein [Actinomycetota bacterium]